MSNNPVDKDKTDLDKWTDQWEKALEAGVFEDAPKPPQPSMNTADHSFFGPSDSNPTETLNESDRDYWSRLNAATKYYGQGYVDPLKIVEEEQRAASMKIEEDDEEEGEVIEENTGLAKTQAADAATGIAQTSHPIKPGSLGMDQDIHDPSSLAHTYTEKDLEDISELKIKLHDLEDKLNTLEAKGSATKKVENQITNMKKRLDDLSDDLNSAFPDKLEG